jgi:hypothetical protein
MKRNWIFLAALATVGGGAMGFASQGCTVTTTDGSVDGGGLSPLDGSTTNTDGSTTNTDGGDGSTTTGGTCSGGIDVGGGQGCQACANTKCCTQQQKCGSDTTPTSGCNAFALCYSKCYLEAKADENPNDCVESLCVGTASNDAIAAFNDVDACNEKNCTTECGYTAPADAGAQDAASE